MTAESSSASGAARERQEIRDAARRLIEGKPIRSTGALTVVQLAAEAGVKRWILTHRHSDLMREFQASAHGQAVEPPVVTKWRAKVTSLEEQLAGLRSENADLRATLDVYASVIGDLADAIDDRPDPRVVDMRSVRRPRGSSR